MAKQGGGKNENPTQNPEKRKSVSAKEKKAQDAKEQRAVVLAKLNEAHQAMGKKIKELEDGGKKVGASIKELFGLNALDLKNAKPANTKFDAVAAKVQDRIDSLNSQLEDVGSSQDEEPDKLHQDIKKLESQAASVGEEFRESEGHCTNAEASLGLLFGLIKDNNLELNEVDQQKQEKLGVLLAELMGALTTTPPQYDKFNKTLRTFQMTYNLLNSNVKEQLKQKRDNTSKPESKKEEKEPEPPEVHIPEPKKKLEISAADRAKLKATLGVGEKQPEKPKTKPVEQAKPTAVKERHEREIKERDKFRILYKEYSQNFKLLEGILKKVGENKYDKEIEVLRGYLGRWSHTDGSRELEVFEEISKAFNKDLTELLAKVDPVIKKAFENGGVLPEEVKEKEKTVAPTTEEQENVDQEEWEDRFDLHKEISQDFRLMESVIVRANKEDKSRKLQEKYNRILDVLQNFLDTAKDTNDLKVFDKNINNFNVTFKALLANLEPDIKSAFENNGVLPKETKKSAEEPAKEPESEKAEAVEEEVTDDQILEELSANVKTSEADSVAAGEIKSPKAKAEVKLPTSKVEVAKELSPEPVVEVVVPKPAVDPAKRVVEEVNKKRAEQQIEIERLSSTEGMVPVSTEVSEPELGSKSKKGLWARIKSAFSKEETREVAKKVTYDTITSVVGLKFIIDALRALGGKGDIAEWWRGRKESKVSKDSITMAFQDLVESLEKSKGNKALAEHEKIENRIANFKAKVESAKISDEAKKALLDRLVDIAKNHQEGAKNATTEKNKEMQRVLDAYLQAKVAGVKIAKDAVNFVLTVSGLAYWRAALYGAASMAERAGKARKEYVKKDLGGNSSKTELGFVAKDVFVNAAIETARALAGKGDKKGASDARRAVDFIKAFGTIARGFGIYGLAVADTTVHEQAIDKLLSQLKERGAVTTVSDNFIEHTKHVWDTYTHLGHNGSSEVKRIEHAETGVAQEHLLPTESQEVAAAVEVTPAFSTDQFAAEYNLSPEFARSLDSLVKQYPELNNPDSMQRILDASQVGGGAHSHHEIIKSKIDTLDESGGERRQVIFEEILKNGSPQSAANYLQSQDFSSRHLGYLSNYNVDKNSPDSYLKFAQEYNKDDNKMVYGLFRAMQGKESTTLANAGLEGNGVDSHVRGKVHYFGLEDKKPILSGSGKVQVVETRFSSSTKAGNAAGENEGMSTDDKLWANANAMRAMKGDAGYDGSSANASIESMSAEERAVLAEIEGDKERFARLGERHIDILDAERSGKPVGEYINNTVQPEAPGSEVSSKRVVISPVTIEDVKSAKVINTYKASEAVPAAEVRPAGSPAEAQPVISAAEKSLPAEAPIVSEPYTDSPLNQFLKENGSNQKEFFGTLEDMRVEATVQLSNSLIFTEDGHKFLQEKIDDMYSLQDHYKDVLQSGVAINKDDLKDINKLLQVEESYESGQSDWMKDWSKAMFNKDDNKAMELAFASHPNADAEPILASKDKDCHAVRIWDADKKKDVFWYDESSIFYLKDGNLIIKDETGESVISKERALELARE